MSSFVDVEYQDFQDHHEFLVKLFAYEIAKFDQNLNNDYPFYPEILSKSHFKNTKTYLVRIHNLLGET